MPITKEQQDAMLEAAKPLMKWLSENCHPHHKAIVVSNRIELLEGRATHSTDEFLVD